MFLSGVRDLCSASFEFATMHKITLFILLCVTYHYASAVNVTKIPRQKYPSKLKVSAVNERNMENKTQFKKMKPSKEGYGKLGDRIPKGKHIKVNSSDSTIASMLDPPIIDLIEHYKSFYLGYEMKPETFDEFLLDPVVKHICDEKDITSHRKIVKNGMVILNPCYPEASKKAAYVKSRNGNIRMYSGYIVNQDYYKSVTYYKHFWFFESSQNSANAPLIIFLRCTPLTYMLAQVILPQENADFTLKYNVLYMDFLNAEGYSYRSPLDKKYHNSFNRALWIRAAILEFFNIFDYSKNDIYIWGDRYSSVTALNTAWVINEMQEISQRNTIKLKGVLCMHSIADVYEKMNYGDIWWNLGLIDARTHHTMIKEDALLRASIMANKYEQYFYKIEVNMMSKYKELLGLFDSPEASLPLIDFLLYLNNLTDYKMNIAHVGNKTYQIDREALNLNNIDGIYRPTIGALNFVLPRMLKNLKILYYNGQIDGIITYKFTAMMLNKIQWPHAYHWYHTCRHLWYDNEEVVGYWKKYNNLNHVLIRNAGHSLESVHPKVFQDMITFLAEDRLPDQNV